MRKPSYENSCIPLIITTPTGMKPYLLFTSKDSTYDTIGESLDLFPHLKKINSNIKTDRDLYMKSYFNGVFQHKDKNVFAIFRINTNDNSLAYRFAYNTEIFKSNKELFIFIKSIFKAKFDIICTR